jgi:hypothetical protein
LPRQAVNLNFNKTNLATTSPRTSSTLRIVLPSVLS